MDLATFGTYEAKIMATDDNSGNAEIGPLSATSDSFSITISYNFAPEI